MYATLLTALLVLAQQPPAGERPAQPGDRPADRTGAQAGAQSLDGAWTVVSCEKDGQAVAKASEMTVTIRNNVATYSGGDETNKMKACRIELGANGTVRVTELDDPSKPAPAADAKNSKTGHIICTNDCVAICLKDAPAAGVRQVGATDSEFKASTAKEKSAMTIFLKRSGAGRDPARTPPPPPAK